MPITTPLAMDELQTTNTTGTPSLHWQRLRTSPDRRLCGCAAGTKITRPIWFTNIEDIDEDIDTQGRPSYALALSVLRDPAYSAHPPSAGET
jgi:hypothetical protein